MLKFYWRAARESLAWGWAGLGVVTTLLPFLPWAVSRLLSSLSTWWIVQAAQNHPVRMAAAGAAIAIVSYVLYAPYAKFKKADVKLLELQEKLKPKFAIEYKEDGQCNLAANCGIPDTPFP